MQTYLTGMPHFESAETDFEEEVGVSIETNKNE